MDAKVNTILMKAVGKDQEILQYFVDDLTSGLRRKCQLSGVFKSDLEKLEDYF